jgi:death-on-curing protein
MTDYIWIDPRALRMLHEESLSTHGGSRGVRDIGLFESALSRPQNLLHYNSGADIADLAASYGYGLAKNHPFVDGNKRAAFLSIGLFLGINGYRLTATPVSAIQAILAVASGEMSEEGLSAWIREHITKQAA